MELIYELDNIISTIGKDEYFAGFLNTKSLEAGIIRLREGQIDTQSMHSMDEIYYVIEGKGLIAISGKNHQINRGSLIFVPAHTEHRFHGNKGEIIVLYIFAKEGLIA
jgi:mannose-6-phosphate isomerase-like protein (cupin superfamily)